MEYTQEEKINELGEQLRKEFREVIVDLVILREDKEEIIVQKRSMDRRLFPGLWEFPGGLLEPHENLLACIRRSIHEECRMRLEVVMDMVHVFTWDNDKDVATAQFLVKATGTYTPQEDKVSDHAFITEDNIDILLTGKDEETPIYRGTFYAFDYLKNRNKGALSDNRLKSTLFFDDLVSAFFSFLQLTIAPPKILICDEGVKRFDIQKDEGLLRISTSYLEEYSLHTGGNIILHQLYHNYQQNILSYDDVKNIRSFIGENGMFYVDIIADTYSFLFLSRHYGTTREQYLRICFESLKEYQGETLNSSKLTRLLGTVLTIEDCSMGTFDAALPVFDEDQNEFHVLKFNKYLQYHHAGITKQHAAKLRQVFTEEGIDETIFLKTIKNITEKIRGVQ